MSYETHRTEHSKDGSSREEYRDYKSRYSREDGPALIIKNADGSSAKYWYEDGLVYRKKGPAITKRRPDGSLVSEAYSELWPGNGWSTDKIFYSRNDGPAIIEYRKDGSVLKETYLCQARDEEHKRRYRSKWKYLNKPHEIYFRPDGSVEMEVYKDYSRYGGFDETQKPSVTKYDEKGRKTSETYYDGTDHVGNPQVSRDKGPAISHFWDDGSIKREEYRALKEVNIYHDEVSFAHREDAPAVIGYSIAGQVILEEYRQWGILKRDNGPAVIHRYEGGAIKREEYYVDGQIQRNKNDKPAAVEYHENGKIKREEYYAWLTVDKEGKNTSVLHRDFKPAVIEFDDKGNVIREEYRTKGVIFTPNDDEPAIIEYGKNGAVRRKEYYQNFPGMTTAGRLHRRGGPAVIEYDVKGKISKEEYYFDGGVVKPGAPTAMRLKVNIFDKRHSR